MVRTALVELHGELDLSTGQLLRRRLDESSVTEHLIVDVSDVPFIDSTALGMLARAAVERGEHDRRVVLVGAGHVVRKVLGVTRLGTLLPHVDSVQDAQRLLLGPHRAIRRTERSVRPSPSDMLWCEDA